MKKDNYYWIMLGIVLVGILAYWLGSRRNDNGEQDSRSKKVEILKDSNFSGEALDLKEVDNASLSGDKLEIRLTGGFSP